MPSTLPTPDELRQHPVVQALAADYTKQFGHHSSTQKAPNAQILWLACSGGRDSLGLAYACVLSGIGVRLIHINHNLQTQADKWQQRVADYAASWSVPFETVNVHLNDKTEVAARNARFDAIFAYMAENDVLLLGHHADDQAETLLMNLCKGSGLKGLSGMSGWSTRHIKNQQSDNKSVHLWRPWLSVTRNQITDFVTQAQLDFVDDPTNTLDNSDNPTDHDVAKNTRAFLRSQVFPQLSSQWGAVVDNMARTATIVAEAEALLTEQTRNDLAMITGSSCIVNQQHQSTLDHTLATDRLLTLPVARQYRVISAWMQGDSVYAPPREQVEQVQRLAESTNNAQRTQIHWQDIQIRRFKQQLFRLPKHLLTAGQQDITLHNQTIITLPSGKWQVQKKQSQHMAEMPEPPAGLPLHLLDKPLRLRPRELGERVHIRGRVGSWPLKKFFQSVQVAPWQRDQAHILQEADEAIALICHAGFFLLESSHQLHTTTNKQQACWVLQPV